MLCNGTIGYENAVYVYVKIGIDIFLMNVINLKQNIYDDRMYLMKYGS